MVNFKSLSCLLSPMIPIHAYLHIHILSPDTKEKNLLLPFHACAISSIADFVCHALPFIFRKKKKRRRRPLTRHDANADFVTCHGRLFSRGNQPPHSGSSVLCLDFVFGNCLASVLIADTRLYILSCQLIGPSVIFLNCE